MNTLQKGIITLLRSAITGETLSLPEDFTLDEALPILKKHSVAPLGYQGAVNCGLDKALPAMQQLLMLYLRILMLHEHQALALNRLFEAFEKNEIAYMPLKGCIIKKLYPKPELRPMGDADILIHVEDHARICPIMEALGFTLKADTTHVFEWKSNTLFTELHKSLVDERETDYYAYYKSGWQLAIKGDGYRHDLSREDAYLFAFVHFAKHYRNRGIGCRQLLDLYVYRSAWPDLDMAYLHKELTKLHLLEFFHNVQRTLDVWFHDAKSDPITELITAFIFASGNWGTMEAGIYAKEVKNAAKTNTLRNTEAKSLLRALFPPLQSMAYNHKILRHFPVLLPFFWLRRAFRLVFFNPGKILRKLKLLRKVNDTQILNYRDSLQAVGLDFHFDTESD